MKPKRRITYSISIAKLLVTITKCLYITSTAIGQNVNCYSNINVSAEGQLRTTIGSLLIEQQGQLKVKGKVRIANDLIIQGFCSSELPASLISIRGIWHNNGFYEGEHGTVEFIGEPTAIAGSSKTDFDNLRCLTDRVDFWHDCDANTVEMLNAHLRCDDKYLRVASTEQDAIIVDQGWVSNSEGGALYRAMTSNNSYLFPVGSDSVQPIIRRVYLEHKGQYGEGQVRLIPESPNLNDLPISRKKKDLIQLNSKWYHEIKGHSTSEMTISIEQKDDEELYETIAQFTNLEWQANYENWSGNGLCSVTGVNNFKTEYFTLGTMKGLFWVPSSFSPNGDNINEVWQPVFDPNIDIQRYELKIFNRNGELLWRTTDPNAFWMPQYPSVGIYAWTMEIHADHNYSDQQNKELARTKFQGHITLIK